MKATTIQKGLKLLNEEVSHETKLLKAGIEADLFGIYDTYGVQHHNYADNFKKWIALTKTRKAQFEQLVEEATTDYNILRNSKGQANYITYDQDALELQLNTGTIYFDSRHFEDYIGAQEIPSNAFEYLLISAREYLQNNWEDHAKEFIINNLQYAEIEDCELENLLN
jgi:homoserine trans-succinylase